MSWNLGKLGIGVAAALSIFACRCPAMAGDLTNGRLQSIAAARATLAKNEAVAWQSVITADRRELTDLHNASIAAMRAENAQSVVAIQKFIIAVRRRLASEEAGRPFPPGFNVPATHTGADPIMAKAEQHRSALVAAAEAQLVKAKDLFQQAVLSADRNVIAQLHARVNAAMKALNANTVVVDMRRLKLAKAQLQADLSSQSEKPPYRGGSGIFGSNLGAKKRIVFVLDHSGATVGKLYLLRATVERAIDGLSPLQKFAVIVFAGQYRILVANRLLRATPANKALVVAQLKTTIAEGRSEGTLKPFLRPFQAAWAMQAQSVLFLTDVPFDPRLVDRIGALNKQRHVAVYTVGSGGTRFKSLLRKISQETGGRFFHLSASALKKRGRGAQPDSQGIVHLFKPGQKRALGSASGSGPGRGGSQAGGSIVTPPPNPIMPLKYQFAWPAHLVNPKFKLTIRRDGTVANVKVLISSGHAGIDQAIINALMQARFLPNIVGGKPVQSKFVIRYKLAS
jgi:TonB family protein